MIKTFHVRTNLQLANVFTKALGVLVFMDLISRLGLINIFSTSITYPKSLQDTELISIAEAALVLRGAIKKKIKGAIELKNGSNCGLKKTVTQTRQCDQSRNQKRLKV